MQKCVCADAQPPGKEGTESRALHRGCSRYSVPSSGMKHREHREGLTKKGLILQVISWTFAHDNLYFSAGQKAMLLDA